MTKKIKFMPRESVAEIEPSPTPAHISIPDWYRDLPVEEKNIPMAKRNRGAVKRCLPYLDALTTGYMLTLPWDLEVFWQDGNQMVAWATNHTNEQLARTDMPHRSKGLPVPEGYAPNLWILVLTPSIETPPGYSCLLTHPFNRYDLPFLTLTGVVDTDKSHRAIVGNVYIREDFTGIIEKGTPVVQVFPFKRENWESETMPYNDVEVKKHLYKVGSVISQSYQKFFWTKKTYR